MSSISPLHGGRSGTFGRSEGEPAAPLGGVVPPPSEAPSAVGHLGHAGHDAGRQFADELGMLGRDQGTRASQEDDGVRVEAGLVPEAFEGAGEVPLQVVCAGPSEQVAAPSATHRSEFLGTGSTVLKGGSQQLGEPEEAAGRKGDAGRQPVADSGATPALCRPELAAHDAGLLEGGHVRPGGVGMDTGRRRQLPQGSVAALEQVANHGQASGVGDRFEQRHSPVFFPWSVDISTRIGCFFVEEATMGLADLVKGFPGKPSHPPLTDASIGTYTAGALMLLLGTLGVEERQMAHGALLAVSLGLILAAPTALTGLLDWLELPKGAPVRTVATVHLFTMVAATVVFALTWVAHLDGYDNGRVEAPALVLGLAGLVLLVGGGYLGGTLAFVYGVRVLKRPQTTVADALIPGRTDAVGGSEGGGDRAVAAAPGGGPVGEHPLGKEDRQ
jgi:uncharacterized membrane protein